MNGNGSGTTARVPNGGYVLGAPLMVKRHGSWLNS